MNKRSQVINIIGSGLLFLVQCSMAQTIGSTSINQSAQNSSPMLLQVFDTYPVDFSSTGTTIDTPICVVGEDAFSKQWLHHHKEKLTTLDAFCFVTNIDSEEALTTLKQIVPKINMAIEDVAWIPQFLGVKHYPVLIMQDEVIQ